MKSNVWMTTGYHSHDDDNIELELIMDSRFTKDDVEKITADYRSKFYRSVMVKAELLKKEN